MHISSNKKPIKKVTASVKILDDDDVHTVLEEIMTSDDCENVVNYSYSQAGTFYEEVFWDSYTFWDINSNESAEDMVDAFYSGKDLDSGEDHADPGKQYFRRDDTYGSVDSTDYPGDIYLDELLDDIIDYIIDNIDAADDMDLSEDVMEAIGNYKEDSDDEDEEDEDSEEE